MQSCPSLYEIPQMKKFCNVSIPVLCHTMDKTITLALLYNKIEKNWWQKGGHLLFIHSLTHLFINSFIYPIVPGLLWAMYYLRVYKIGIKFLLLRNLHSGG